MNTPFLVEERIYLRPLDEEDLDRRLRWTNDPEIVVTLGRRSESGYSPSTRTATVTSGMRAFTRSRRSTARPSSDS